MHTLKAFFRFEEEIKKSRFIVNASPVQSPEEAFQFLKNIQEQQASHNCWAYRIGQQYRFSDDGEPGGTAGKPILSAIERQEIDYVMVVVTRYFGGTKLGAGGLIRAYGGCASKCIQSAPKCEIILKSQLQIETTFEWTGQIYAMFDKFKVEKIREVYHEHGISLEIKLKHSDLDAFTKSLKDLSSGNINIKSLQPK
jgi:uncharacterized YigZ family protein